jgi:hypothetical protein
MPALPIITVQLRRFIRDGVGVWRKVLLPRKTGDTEPEGAQHADAKCCEVDALRCQELPDDKGRGKSIGERPEHIREIPASRWGEKHRWWESLSISIGGHKGKRCQGSALAPQRRMSP